MDLYSFLADHNIDYERYDHPPVYTCDDVKLGVPPLPAARTKNLFARDKKGLRHFLIVVSDEKMIDLKSLSSLLETGRLSLASPERLKKYLGSDPGAVLSLLICPK